MFGLQSFQSLNAFVMRPFTLSQRTWNIKKLKLLLTLTIINVISNQTSNVDTNWFLLIKSPWLHIFIKFSLSLIVTCSERSCAWNICCSGGENLYSKLHRLDSTVATITIFIRLDDTISRQALNHTKSEHVYWILPDKLANTGSENVYVFKFFVFLSTERNTEPRDPGEASAESTVRVQADWCAWQTGMKARQVGNPADKEGMCKSTLEGRQANEPSDSRGRL